MKALFLVLDTVRRDFLTPYGNTWVQTPNLTRLARQGVVFDNHWVGSLPCMPARREFMTGRYNFIYRGWGPIEPYDDTLPHALKSKRVFSHLLTDHYHYFELGGEDYHTAFNTWEFMRGQELDQWVSLVDSVALPEPDVRSQNRKNRLRQQQEEDFSGARTCAAAVEWLHDNRNADNWFLQVELFDPHEPYYCTEKYRKMYDDVWDGPELDWPPYEIVSQSPEAVEHIRKMYASLLTMTDHWAGKVLSTLEELGLFEDTLIVFTTDHGTMLAEHQYWLKNYMPVYNQIASLPLTIKPAASMNVEAKPGSRVSAFSQTIDIMPTFLDAFGVPLLPHVYGQSLLPALSGKSLERTDGIMGYFGMATNYTDGKHVYMRNPVNSDGGPLYAYTAMPNHSLNRLHPRDGYSEWEMGRYFGHTYNMPLYKIPSKGSAPLELPGEESYVARHQLWGRYSGQGAELTSSRP